MIHQCPVCKATVPIDSKLGDFCTEPNCPSYMSNQIPEETMPELVQINQSKFCCPCCGNQLWIESDQGNRVLYCGSGYGLCESHVVNAIGSLIATTEKEAYDRLCRLYEEELMQNDNV